MRILANSKKLTFSYRSLFAQAHQYSFNDFTKLNPQSQKLVELLSENNYVRLWSLQQLFQKSYRSNINQKNQKSLEKISHPLNIVINKHFSTLEDYEDVDCKNIQRSQKNLDKNVKNRNLIEDLNGSKDWIFLPNFYNIFKRHQKTNSNDLFLLIGDFNGYFMNFYSQRPFITLEQLCAIFPEKVPLSYRSRQKIEKVKETVQNRLKKANKEIALKQEPKFSQIIFTHDRIKMWDEAIQIMLDQLPIKITVPFHCAEKQKSFYKLNLNDLIEGFKTSHKIIHPNIPLQIDHQNARDFIEEAFLTLTSNQRNPLKSKYQVQVMDKEIASKNFTIDLN